MLEEKTLPLSQYSEIKEKIGNGKPTMLAFGMRHCYSCLSMSKRLMKILEVHPSLQIYAIDGQKERLVVRDVYGFKEMPTQIVFNEKGEEIMRHTGAYALPVLEILLKKWGFLS